MYIKHQTYLTNRLNKGTRKFCRRMKGQPVPGHPGVVKDPTIGRVYIVHLKNCECSHLRLL